LKRQGSVLFLLLRFVSYACASVRIRGLDFSISFIWEYMRIKIIGDNNCARATRHLLRLAGFAVTEFLPAEVVTQAPHSGYAITIERAIPATVFAPEKESNGSDFSSRALSETLTSIPGAPSRARTRLAPAPQPLIPVFASNDEATAGAPASEPDSPTHGQPAVHGEALPSEGGASSPASLLEGENSPEVEAGAGDVRFASDGRSADGDVKCKQAKSHSTGNIHFDSVDCELESAVLRHVTQLAGAPVMVDRPGGVVHSERELRIILPVTGDARTDEAAAVAVEFGVLRGLLDLTRRPSHGELRGGAAGEASQADGESGKKRSSGKKWWIFGGIFLAVCVALFGAGLQATPRLHGGEDGKNAQADGSISFTKKVHAKGGTAAVLFRSEALRKAHLVRSEVLRTATAFAAAEPQGQFSTGQTGVDPCLAQTKVFASINQTANTQLAAGTASKKIYICSIHVVVAAATSVALVEGTGSVCGTGTAGVSGFGGATPATGWNFMANGGIVLGNGAAAVGAEGTSADDLCLFNSGSGQVSGGISYVVQ
jgi:hypothetical protein